MRLRVIEPGSAAFDSLKRELAAADLSTTDLLAEGGRYYALGETDQEALAFVGLVAFGDDALLRSLVTPAAGRGAGHGGEAVTRLIELTQAYGVARLWLMTTNAEPFFARHGFAPVDRGQAPPAIVEPQQFRELCPASAALMRRNL